MNARRWLVTGGAGFIGSNFVRYVLDHHRDLTITVLDKLTYAGNRENLHDLEGDSRYRFVQGDIADPAAVEPLMAKAQVIVNFAAETHVDRSIVDATAFLRTNLIGTQVLLEAARRARLGLFVQISTDEVYGSIAEGAWTEEQPLRPHSPYAASKAGADLLVQAYAHTYGLPAIITRSSNNYGPYQYPEKFIPLAITNLLEGESIPLYGDGLNVRDWIHVQENCEAIDLAIQKGRPGEIYHIGSGVGLTNRAVAEAIVEALHQPVSKIQPVPDRPGHDRRYALEIRKIQALGWAPRRPFDEGLRDTMVWYQVNDAWWRRLKRRDAMHWLSTTKRP